MENKTINQKELFLSQVRSSWFQEVFILCTIVPMGLIGTALNFLYARLAYLLPKF